MRELEKPQPPKKFGARVGIGNYRYGKDTNPKIKKSEKIDRKKVIDNIIFNALINKHYTEKDIQHSLFYTGLLKGLILVHSP